MSTEKSKVGQITWHDLTVPNAEALRDFYSAVAGWTWDACPVADYQDFSMNAADGTCLAGVCHARGVNAGIPPQWLMYVNVANLDQSMAACTSRGGTIVVPDRPLYGGRFCVIRDPAGAVCALFQP